MAGRYHSIDDLPATLPVFPLTGVLLLPRGQLPLNVFEPRYLAMVDAALSGSRMIGMIQPTEHEEKALKPALSAVGCAGRITAYRETDDGRYLITLTGICRFRVAEEIASRRRRSARCSADYAPFAGDLADGGRRAISRASACSAALNDYLARRDLKADWRSVMNAPAETLVNALVDALPVRAGREAGAAGGAGLAGARRTLLALLEMAGVPPARLATDGELSDGTRSQAARNPGLPGDQGHAASMTARSRS